MSELISSTNELTDVNGMSKTSSGPGPVTAAVAQEQVGGDQAAEEQAVGAEVDPHGQLGVGQARGRVVAVSGGRGRVDGGVSHRRSPPRARRSAAGWLGRDLAVAVVVVVVAVRREVLVVGRLERPPDHRPPRRTATPIAASTMLKMSP